MIHAACASVVHERGVRLVAAAVTGLGFVGLPSKLWCRREQAVQVRRKPAGEGFVALDHFEQGLLLAEEVLLGTCDDSDLEVASQPA